MEALVCPTPATLYTPHSTPHMRLTFKNCPYPSFRVDDAWHHIAVSWDQTSGETTCLVDGESKVAFWRNSGGVVQV